LGALDEIERSLGAPSEKLRSQLAIARRGVSRVVRAADRLQRTAELERGDPSFAMATVDLRGVAEAAALDVRGIETRKGIQLDVSVGDEPSLATVDAGWLQNAIGEIVGNAIRFARSKVSVDTRTVDGEVRITIWDDGAGFARPPSLERFEAPTSRAGLGLSLPLVHDVLTSHRGRLEIASVNDASGNEGCAVMLVLPTAAPER
jgi:signal transduction histidine kinase